MYTYFFQIVLQGISDKIERTKIYGWRNRHIHSYVVLSHCKKETHLGCIFHLEKTVNVRNPEKRIISSAIDASYKWFKYLLTMYSLQEVLITCFFYKRVVMNFPFLFCLSFTQSKYPVVLSEILLTGRILLYHSFSEPPLSVAVVKYTQNSGLEMAYGIDPSSNYGYYFPFPLTGWRTWVWLTKI